MILKVVLSHNENENNTILERSDDHGRYLVSIPSKISISDLYLLVDEIKRIKKSE